MSGTFEGDARSCAGNPVWESAFLDFMQATAGLVLHPHQREEFRRHVRAGCDRFGFAGPLEYLAALRAARSDAPELEYLIAATTVGETYFFRDSAQMTFLREQWLPELIARRRLSGRRTLKIWSAGCATGEEIYTLAMIVHELIPDIGRWDVRLIGTDLNAEALARASQGRYGNWSLRDTPDEIRRTFFEEVGGRHVLNESVRRMVCFSRLNLAAAWLPSGFAGEGAIDLVLCRNVFIYLSKPVIASVMRKFTATLAPGGLLMLAPADLPGSFERYDGLTYCQDGAVFYFRRDAGSDVPGPVECPEPVGPDTLPAARFQSASDTPAAASLNRNHDPESDPPAGAASGSALDADTVEALRGRAEAFADRGQPKRAIEICETALERDRLDPRTWFLHALLMMDAGDCACAEADLRRALYACWDFPEAHARLGLLSAQAGDRRASLRHFEDARAVLREADPDTLLQDRSGMKYRELDEILAGDMALLAGADDARSRS